MFLLLTYTPQFITPPPNEISRLRPCHRDGVYQVDELDDVNCNVDVDDFTVGCCRRRRQVLGLVLRIEQMLA